VREQRAWLLVLPNDLESHDKTYLRDAMLQAPVIIRPRNWQTPTRVVDLLLCFVENIDNASTLFSCPSMSVSGPAFAALLKWHRKLQHVKERRRERREQGRKNGLQSYSLLRYVLSAAGSGPLPHQQWQWQ
jgi:hypothetical protein